MRFYAFRAGISEREFWGMTAFAVVQAFRASEESMSRLAYRTAIYQRISHKHLPKTEDEIFAKPKAKTQSLRQQFAIAKLMTKVMSKEQH